MAAYMYLTESDRKKLIEPLPDEDVNEAFQEALKYDNSLLITSYHVLRKSLLRKTTTETMYQLYHDCAPDKPAYQARYQISASGKKNSVIAYLHGIINGALAQSRNASPYPVKQNNN